MLQGNTRMSTRRPTLPQLDISSGSRYGDFQPATSCSRRILDTPSFFRHPTSHGDTKTNDGLMSEYVGSEDAIYRFRETPRELMGL